MAKPIFVTEEEVNKILDKVRGELLRKKCSGSLNVNVSLEDDGREALLNFTPKAWLKMNKLVEEFSTEVQWHGSVRRIGENAFEVYDIIVFPHKVTGATVISDNEEYTKWLDSLGDDMFNSIRFHGHSHVRMAVNPSGVDTGYRKNLISQLPPSSEGNDVFYIFMIVNKLGDISSEIYDFTNNALYETKQIHVTCELDENETLSEFISGAKKIAVEDKPETPKYTSNGYPVYNATAGKKKKEKEETKAADKAKYDYGTYSGNYYGSYGGYGAGVYDEDDPLSPFYVRGY